MRSQPEVIKRINILIHTTEYMLTELRRIKKQIKQDIVLERA